MTAATYSYRPWLRLDLIGPGQRKTNFRGLRSSKAARRRAFHLAEMT